MTIMTSYLFHTFTQIGKCFLVPTTLNKFYCEWIWNYIKKNIYIQNSSDIFQANLKFQGRALKHTIFIQWCRNQFAEFLTVCLMHIFVKAKSWAPCTAFFGSSVNFFFAHIRPRKCLNLAYCHLHWYRLFLLKAMYILTKPGNLFESSGLCLTSKRAASLTPFIETSITLCK